MLHECQFMPVSCDVYRRLVLLPVQNGIDARMCDQSSASNMDESRWTWSVRQSSQAACASPRKPRAMQDSSCRRVRARLQQGGLQPDLERGNRACMFAEGRFDMSERLFCWFPRRARRRFALAAECCAYRALCGDEPSPDPVGSGFAQLGAKPSKCPQLVTARGGLLEELPQACRGKREAFDLVRDPDTVGSSAAIRSTTIAAEDPPATNRF